MKKYFLSLVVVVTLCTSLIPITPNVVYAANTNNQESDMIEDRSMSAGVAIFVAGVLVGYVVDGVVIYTTGHSAGEWTAKAIRYASTHPGINRIYFATSSSNASGGGSGGGAW